jgi:hypothetical protein
MPPNWQISQRVSLFSPPLAVARGREVPGTASCTTNLLLLVCPQTEWMCEHGSTGIQVLHPTESAYCTRYDVNRASVHVQRTRTSVGNPTSCTITLGVGINRLTVNRSAKNPDRLTDRFNRLTDSLTGYCSDPCNAFHLLLIILWSPACALFVVWRLNTVRGRAPGRSHTTRAG